MGDFSRQYVDYIQDDWSTILGAPLGLGRDAWRIGLKGLMWWNVNARKEFLQAVKQEWAARSAYTRMHSFMYSWVSFVAGTNKIELLNTQISFWSISRAFAMALMIGSIEAAAFYFVFVWKFLGQYDSMWPIALILAIQIGLLSVAASISYAAYSRICSTIFALCYVASRRNAVGAAYPTRES
jgi:hypothetical protein